jgi:outer membrane lipoprotein carrier protein
MYLFIVNLQAQNFTSATPEQKQLMFEKILAASVDMQSLICDFEQIKDLSILNEKMISKGKMYYNNNNCLRWESVLPYKYIFVLNNNRILMQSDNSKNTIDVKSSKLFQEIVKIMMNSVNGKGLIDSKSFDVSYFWEKEQWIVILTPLQKEIRKMFPSIKLIFNTKNYTVEQVIMEEKNGDCTIILLYNKLFNKNIDNEKFTIE